MRSFTVLPSLLWAAFISACAQAPTAEDPAMVIVARQDALFVPVSAQLPDGPRIAVLWGNPDTGPSAILLEMKQGSVPLHLHTVDYHLTVIEGETKHWAAGESASDAKVLGPGSYWFQPGGAVHGDACLTPTCLVQVVWAGPRDARLAPGPG